MIHPVLYRSNETKFNHLGLGVLKDAVSCFVTEELNGVFEMELVYPSKGIHAELLDVDMIIKADAGHASFSRNQRFRIERVDKDIDGMIRVFGRHVSYLAGSLVLQPNVEIHDLGAEGALRLWSQSIVGSHPFSVGSNITGRRSTTLSVNNHPNARGALGGTNGSILDVWGGEFIFDNYRIDLRAERGGRANTLISYGRNLTDLNQEENIANTFTSVYPYAVVRDGDKEEIITIPEFVVDSEHAESFAHRRVLPVDFSREFDRDERPTVARLRELVLAYIEANDIGVPKVSISLSFVDLSKTLNASGIPYEEIGLGDMIPVKFEKLGVETVSKVVRVQWNVLLGQYESLDVGAMRQTLGDTVRNVQREVNEVSNNSNDALRAANGKNTTFFGPDEPVATRIGDLWFRPNGDVKEMWQWTGHGWELIVMTSADAHLLERIVSAEADARNAIDRANNAVEEAHELLSRVDPMFSLTDELNNRVTSITAKAEGIQTRVEHQEKELASSMTQLIDKINLRVSVDDIINQINISTEGVSIDGSRVRITGETFIENGVIRDAHIQNVSADKITTGTLNAADIRVINLDASSVSGGTLAGTYLRGCDIRGSLIETEATINNQNSRIRLHGGRMEVFRANQQMLQLDNFGINLPQAGTSISFGSNKGMWINGNNTTMNLGRLVESEIWGFENVGGTAGALIQLHDNTIDFQIGGERIRMRGHEVIHRTSSGVESSMGFSPVRLEVDRIDTTTMFTGTINASFVNTFGVNATRLSAGNSHLTHDVNGRLRITSDAAGSNTQAIHTNGMIVGAWNMGGAAGANVNRTTYANGWCGTVGNFNFNIARNNTNRILLQEHTTTIRAGGDSGNTSRTTVYLDHRGNSPTWFGIGQSGTDVAFSQRAYVRSPAIYSRTSTASSNWLRTTAYGTINRVTSAKRYKLNVQKEEDLDFAKRLLNVSPASWFDRFNAEAYASMITSSMDSRGRVDWKKVEEKAKEEVEPITRIGGLIAEDVEAAGLNMYVSYGADGKTVEGVQYDRLWTLLIPLVREQQKQIESLTARLEELERGK